MAVCLKTVQLEFAAKQLLKEHAAANGVSVKTYLHALIHYATSCERRSGSWEAETPFAFYNYDERTGNSCADRWFTEEK